MLCARTSLDLLSIFNRLRIPKKTLPFCFFPNANLNPDFQKCIAFGELSKPRPRVLSGNAQTTFLTPLIRLSVQCDHVQQVISMYHTLPSATD